MNDGRIKVGAWDRIGSPLARALDGAIAAAASSYVRERQIPKLLAATPEELADHSPEGRQNLIGRLLRLAHASARAGANGHWSFDPNRHIAILGALHAEQVELSKLVGEDVHQMRPRREARRKIST